MESALIGVAYAMVGWGVAFNLDRFLWRWYRPASVGHLLTWAIWWPAFLVWFLVLVWQARQRDRRLRTPAAQRAMAAYHERGVQYTSEQFDAMIRDANSGRQLL